MYAEGPTCAGWYCKSQARKTVGWRRWNYFFAFDGSLVKRERYLDEKAANTSFAEKILRKGGRLLKEHTHHRALVRAMKIARTSTIRTNPTIGP